jgi:tRNA(His) guanylyltransferase
MSNDSLGDRMKQYEDCYRITLPARMPIIIRLDGKAFHSYTKKCAKPIDLGLIQCMNETTKYLCANIQGTQLAYVQSDEVSLLLNNYTSLESQGWFDNNIQKMVSVSAAMASAIFTANSWRIWGEGILKPAFFDSRVFVLPKEEVCNAMLWRQQDATRNSVQMLARSLYSHKQCTDKNNSELQEMIFQRGVNWNDCPTYQKRGRCVIKQVSQKPAVNKRTGESVVVNRSEWIVDDEIPIFSQVRQYIERYV